MLKKIYTLLIALALSPPALANNGITWLLAQAQNDGDYSTVNDLATPFMATVETLQTLYQRGDTSDPSIANALSFINTSPFPSTEILSQTLIIKAHAEQSIDSVYTELINRMGQGLGDLENYDNTVIDTAWTLEALSNTDTATDILAPAIEYLLEKQHDNGGWADNDNDTSIYTTAIVMHALWQYRHDFDVNSVLNNAQNYLSNEGETFENALSLIALLPRLTTPDEISDRIQALRDAQLTNGSWEDDVYTTALALRALSIADSPQSNPDLGQITGTVIDAQSGLALSGMTVELLGIGTQNTDSAGKFTFEGLAAGDYTIQIGTNINTEITLSLAQEISLGTIRFFQADSTNIQGTVTDVNTGFPIIGARIQITGLNDPLFTNDQGIYLASNLEAGEITIQTSFEGYLTNSKTFTLNASSSLLISTALSADQATLTGIITDGSTASPLENVSLFIDDTLAAQTESDGSYLITPILNGEHNIRVELPDYDTLSVEMAIPNYSTNVFSPSLYPTGTSPTIEDNSSIIGTVLDEITQLPLIGVTVSNGTETITTDDNGQFSFTNLAAGETTLEFSLSNYIDKSLTFTLSAFTALDLKTINLMPFKVPAGFSGFVMDASTQEPLSDVEISFQFADTSGSLINNTDGSFEYFSEVNALVGELSFTKEGYTPVNLQVVLRPNKSLELRGVGLLPEGMNLLLPDLVITQVDSQNVNTNPESLEINGSLIVTLENIGTTAHSSAVQLLAFHDVNLNGLYDENIDTPFGEITIESELARWETTQVEITVAGILPFIKAPISLWIDNQQTVLERDEQNNTESTASECQAIPDKDILVLSGSYGIGNQDPYFTYTKPNETELLTPVGIPDPYWVNPPAGTWIGPPNGAYTGNVGHYIYTYTFVLNDPNNVLSFLGQFSSDNSIVGYLNEEEIFTGPFTAFGRLYSFSANLSFFKTGINELRFDVYNGGGPTGFYINAKVDVPDDLTTNAADLTVTHFHLIDNGTDFSLAVRIGNGGANTTTSNVTFYADTSILGTVTVPALAAGAYQDIQLENITFPNLDQTISVVVDADNQIFECDETNNTASTIVNAAITNVIGNITLTTDSEEYQPNTPVAIEYTITNLGTLPADFQVKLQLLDFNGQTVKILDTPSLNTLAGGEAITLNTEWNTGTTLTGTYQLQAILLSGEKITEANTYFDISTGDAPVLNLRTTVDKLIYHTTDTVLISNIIRNLSTSTTISEAVLHLVIENTENQSVFTQDIPLNELVPGAVQDISLSFSFTNAAEETYTVKSTVENETDVTTYQIQADLNISLTGTVTAQSTLLNQGETQICTDTLTNTASSQAVDIRQILLAVKNGQKLNITSNNLNLGTISLERTLSTNNLVPGNYACLIQAKINGEWKSLDYANFQVDKPLFSLLGTVAVQESLVHLGDTQTCTDTLINNGALDITDQNIRQVWLKNDQIINQTEQSLDITTIENLERTWQAPEIGDYACRLEAEINGQWEMLAKATWQVQTQPLEGFVEVQFPNLYQGETQTCTDTITNHEIPNFTDYPFRQSLISSETGEELNVTDFNLTLAPETSEVLERSILTETLPIGQYACDLSMSINSEWLSLAEGVFLLEEPPIQIESTLTAGQRGRILILLDKSKSKDSDPHGPKNAPTLTAQREFLENLLEDYTIVTDAKRFTQEFRSGAYQVYALFSEDVKLDKYVQKELREAVYRGEGLVVAGDHDQRNHYLDEPLGIKFKGKESKATGLTLTDLSVINFAFEEKAQRVELKGAASLGTFNCGYKTRKKNKYDDDDDDDRGKKDDDDDDDDRGKKDDDDDDDDDDDHHQKSCGIAETYYEYGLGHSISVAFDLLAQATAAGLESPLASLLTDALDLAQIGGLDYSTGKVIPIYLNLTNVGIATPGQAVISLPLGTNIVAPISLEISEAEPNLIWPFELAVDAEAEFKFWPRLAGEVLPIEVEIQTGIDPNFKVYDNLSLEIPVLAQAHLVDVVNTLEALPNKDKYADKALKYLKKAAEAKDTEKALKELLKVTDNLQKSKMVEAHDVRVIVGHLIRLLSF